MSMPVLPNPKAQQSPHFLTGRDYSVVSYYLGLDLGQSNDYSALTVLRETWAIKRADPAWQNFWQESPIPDDFIRYDIVHLERFPLGTSYVEQAETVYARVQRLRYETAWQGSITRERHAPLILLAVDYTGVGRGVGDVFTRAGLNYIPVTITGGSVVKRDAKEGDYHVPKRELVTTTQVLIQQGRLHVAPQLEDAEILRNELANFKYRITQRGETFGASGSDGPDWRENEHDDQALAAFIAVWVARYNREQQVTNDRSREAVRRLQQRARDSQPVRRNQGGRK